MVPFEYEHFWIVHHDHCEHQCLCQIPAVGSHSSIVCFLPFICGHHLLFCLYEWERIDFSDEMVEKIGKSKSTSFFRNNLNHFKTTPLTIRLYKYYDHDDSELVEQIKNKNWKGATNIKSIKREGVFLVRFLVESKYAGNLKAAIDKKVASAELDTDEFVKADVTCSKESMEYLY